MAANNEGFVPDENYRAGSETVPPEEMFRERHNPDEVVSMSPTDGSGGKVGKYIGKQCFMKHNIFLTLWGAVIILVITWVLLYLIFHQEVLPSGDLFRIIVLVITSYIVGIGFSLIHLPALLGMLITGVVLKTVGFFHISGVYPNIVAMSRNVALAVILTRAGLGLDAAAMRRLKFTVLKLAVIPCCGEAIGGAVFSHFLIGFPWLWAFLLGFLLSAVSPAVVVPTLLSLKEKGYGEDKGIATLVVAASSLDDIVSISVFGIFFSSIFSHTEDLTMEIIRGPCEIVIGLLIGILWGFLCAFIPHKNDPFVVSKRTAMIGIGALVAVLGSTEINFAGSGPLACITGSFVAALCWKVQGWSPDKPSPVSKVFYGFWIVMQPILFSLIGTEIDLYALVPENVGYGVAIVLLSLFVRVIVVFLTLIGDDLNFREMIFVNICWLPKATVQAVLCAAPFDQLVKEPNPSEDDLDRAMMVITIGILSIILTAPVGAIGMSLTGTHLLNKNEQPNLSYFVRITVCFLSLIGDKLNMREIIFVNFCWLPKATVQAALCAQALDQLKKESNPSEDDLNRAKMLITTAIIAVIITAPIGAVAISLSGPKFLSKINKPQQDICLT